MTGKQEAKIKFTLSAMRPDSMKRHSLDIRLRGKMFMGHNQMKKSLKVTKNKDYFNLNCEIRGF